jgi:hypothetical protein
MSKMAATEALIKIRHRILKGDSEISYGKKVWEYDDAKDRSILVYKDELSKYDGLPLLAVKGKLELLLATDAETRFYKKEGFLPGFFTGILSSLIASGIWALITYLIKF